MRKTFTKVLTLALCATMVAFSFAGCNTKNIEKENNISEEKIPAESISDENEADVTESIIWDISENGTLTLSGNGPMKDYEHDSEEDWLAQKDSIKKVIIGDGITSVGSHAFSDCNNMKIVMLPDSLEIIGNDAFVNCSLEEIDIPAHVSKIGQAAFFLCNHLASINVDENNPYYLSTDKGLFDKNQTELILVPASFKIYTVPNGVTTIDAYAFDNCDFLETVRLPVGITNIETYALRGYDITELEYFGTTSQWNDISLGKDWNQNASFTSVQCSDGTVELG